MEVKNAVIKSARLTNEDHGCLVAWLSLDYGGSGQGFGGYCLYSTGKDGGSAGYFIDRCLKIAGVNEWSDLVGKTIRVKSEHRGVKSIGHILNDDWFTPDEDLEKHIVKETENGK